MEVRILTYDFGAGKHKRSMYSTPAWNHWPEFNLRLLPSCKGDWKTDLFWETMCPAKLRVYVFEEEEEMGIRGLSVFCHNRDVSLGLCGCEKHNLSVIPHSAEASRQPSLVSWGSLHASKTQPLTQVTSCLSSVFCSLSLWHMSQAVISLHLRSLSITIIFIYSCHML